MKSLEFMKTYEFTVTLYGTAENQQDAWDDAIEAFCNDPGEPHEEVLVTADNGQ